MNDIKLGIFDLGLITTDRYSLQTIEDTLFFAQKAEQLGFTRYWIGEHHGHDVAWRSPEILLTLLAAGTENIRIGSAGVLLYYHKPLLCAQDYKLLANIFAGRIDLGLARSVAADGKIHELLADEECFDQAAFQKRAALVRSFLTTGEERAIFCPPSTDIVPEMWVLGTSLSNFQFAYENQMHFSLSLCHQKFSEIELNSMAATMTNARQLSADDRPSQFKYNLMVNMICADTQEKAIKIANERAHATLQINCAGGPKQCSDFIIDLQNRFNPNEIIVSDACKNVKEKMKSMSLLSKHLNLTRRDADKKKSIT
jgi:luciferase family oxidoreductase group 1